ncbi:probable dolichol-phosphate mannosyltransferase subunit 3 [Chelonus insularis]|uniref:probable dolichol-phosphate mannosyltransferase subunit 3 n=1 Tax=Chelonus insularis TaxID=460826 RepID=UPI00158CD935|nr:probable dolichol-phosphate mannosyltransferase subunit 3 [Chelonus insularis]
MTKLMEWLFCFVLFMGPWTAAISGAIDSPFINEHRQLILFLPFFFLVVFGIYAVTVVLYRTFTFNDCEEAAGKLRTEIAQAQAELRIKGVLPRDPKGPELM